MIILLFETLLGLVLSGLPMDRLEARVDAALTSRDSFCVSLREQAPPLLFAQADPISLGRMGVLLSNAEAGRNPWFHLLRGLYEIRTGSGKGPMFVDNALFVAKDDAGTQIALSLELQRQGEFELSLRTATSANKTFRNAGGTRSVYLEGLWRQAALRDTARSDAWLTLAAQVSKAALDGSSTPDRSVFAWPGSILSGTWSHGWRASFELFRQVWSLVRAVFAWFLILVVLALGIRHLPAVLHPLQEMTGFLSVGARRVLAWLPLAGFVAAGWVVLAWVILLVTASRWRSPAERWGGLIAGLCLVLAPVDAMISGAFLDVDARAGGFGTVVAALDGTGLAEDTLLAGAITHARAGNTAQALRCLQLSQPGSRSGWAQDLEGWVLGRDASPAAREVLESAWKRDKNPWTGIALGKTVDSTLELQRQVALGQGVGLPEPTPFQAFELLFLSSLGDGPFEAIWVPRSVVPLPIFGWMGCVFLIVLIVLSASNARNERGIEPCVVCGHTTCPRCRKSALCESCLTRLAEAENAVERRLLRLRLVAKRVDARRLFGKWTDMLLPGWGGLASSTSPAWGTLTFFAVTCVLLGIGAHAILWIGDVEGTPSFWLRMSGCLPFALWIGVLMPVRRMLLERESG